MFIIVYTYVYMYPQSPDGNPHVYFSKNLPVIYDAADFQTLSAVFFPLKMSWLVVEKNPLKNMSSSVGMIIETQYEWENKIDGNQTTK